MRFVIYDDDTMEPVTVVSVPWFGEKDIEQLGRRLLLSAPPPQELVAFNPEQPKAPFRERIVELRFEQFVRHGRLSWMCFTREAELAMLLDPDWLSGQRRHINEIKDGERALIAMLARALSS
jgi:hypothetical protein